VDDWEAERQEGISKKPGIISHQAMGLNVWAGFLWWTKPIGMLQ
jgi:hypothetical protein